MSKHCGWFLFLNKLPSCPTLLLISIVQPANACYITGSHAIAIGVQLNRGVEKYKAGYQNRLTRGKWSFVWMHPVKSELGVGWVDGTKIWKGLLASARIKGSNRHLLNLYLHLVVNLSLAHKAIPSQVHVTHLWIHLIGTYLIMFEIKCITRN